jgi:hypothetical protein
MVSVSSMKKARLSPLKLHSPEPYFGFHRQKPDNIKFGDPENTIQVVLQAKLPSCCRSMPMTPNQYLYQ